MIYELIHELSHPMPVLNGYVAAEPCLLMLALAGVPNRNLAGDARDAVICLTSEPSWE